jgi:hypothetical protein
MVFSFYTPWQAASQIRLVSSTGVTQCTPSSSCLLCEFHVTLGHATNVLNLDWQGCNSKQQKKAVCNCSVTPWYAKPQ